MRRRYESLSAKTLELPQPKLAKTRQKNKSWLLESFLYLFLGFLCFCGAMWLLERSGSKVSFSDYVTSLRSLMAETETEKTEAVKVCVEQNVTEDVFLSVKAWHKSMDEPALEDASVVRYSKLHDASCSAVVSTKDEGNFDLVWQRYYVLVVGLNSTVETVTGDDIFTLLGEGTLQIGDVHYTVAVETGSIDALDRAVGIGVGVTETSDVIALVNASQTTIGVIPFENLTYRVKEVSVDGSSLRAGIVDDEYPLVDQVWIDAPKYPDLFDQLQDKLGPLTYDTELIKTVVVTGTSVVGARGWFATSMANGDWMYPLRNVGDILREASIAHISNEGSRVDGCEQYSWTLVFCGPPAAYDALTWTGIDVVGLTGNHILDYRSAGFISTLDWYDSVGIKYFGGGRNSVQAHTPAIIDLGTVKIGFLGYSMIPPSEYYATSTTPGSAPLDEPAVRADIAAAKELADYVFVDMQWGNEYERIPNSYQTDYGKLAIDSGATVVSGVHPHWIQPLELYKEGLIFYGLGNFLFDQTWSQETREGVMVRHYFYGSTYLGFELIPTIIDDEKQVDLAIGPDRERIAGYVTGGL